METQRTLNSRSSSDQKSNAGGITIPDLKLYYRAITIQAAWYLHKNRQEDQSIRIENPDINPSIYNQLTFSKESKTRDGEKTASLTNATGKTGYPHAED
jgi:uncharacterized protein (DUF736 family)